jgi:hypothetical protein
LRPGGYLEFQDALFQFRCDERTLEGTALEMWTTKLIEAASKCGQDWTCSTRYKQYMEDAGLTDVKEFHYRWPINIRPTNEHEKKIGGFSLQNLLQALESISLAPMTRNLNMSMEEVHETLKRVKIEIMSRDFYTYIPV